MGVFADIVAIFELKDYVWFEVQLLLLYEIGSFFLSKSELIVVCHARDNPRKFSFDYEKRIQGHFS